MFCVQPRVPAPPDPLFQVVRYDEGDLAPKPSLEFGLVDPDSSQVEVTEIEDPVRYGFEPELRLLTYREPAEDDEGTVLGLQADVRDPPQVVQALGVLDDDDGCVLGE